jgi:hypothetical protein
VQHRRVDVDERNTGKASNKRHKLIQIIRTTPGNKCSADNDQESEPILLPLDLLGVFSASSGRKDTRFNNTDSGEELQRRGKQDGEGVQELHAVDELAVLRQVEDNHGLSARTVCCIAERAHGDKDRGDNDHNPAKDFGELFGVLHGFLDGDDEADSLEGENCCTDEERPVVRVEGADVGDAAGRESEDVIVIQVDEAKDDEEVGNQSGSAEFCHITNHREGEEDEHLQQNEPFHFNVFLIIRYRHYEVVSVGSLGLQRGNERIKACRFSEVKTMYADAKPICDTTIDNRINFRIVGPYRWPPISVKTVSTYDVARR